MNKRVRQLVLASLLLFILAACAPGIQASPTALPSVQVVQPSSTPTESVATPIDNSRNREAIEYYTVVDGDTLSSIAAEFDLQPETVLWANYDLLFDNPDFLMPEMELLILPVDGVYHQVGGTDTVESIAAFFAAEQQDILDWPGNGINNSVIFAGHWLLVPGGERGLRRRLMPNLPSYAMAVSVEEFGSGACPENLVGGAIGGGQYAWPVAQHEPLGEVFSDIHQGIDLAVSIGADVLAADDGVIVFSGWSNFGYGRMVMIDHGNGDFTLYGGLGDALEVCGASVAEGQAIGEGGAIGHPVGPFLHFEIRRGEEFLDPLTVLPN